MQTAVPVVMRGTANTSVGARAPLQSARLAGLRASKASLGRGPARSTKMLVQSVATPEQAPSDEAYEPTFVTERDRRTAAKTGLYAVLPEKALSTSFSAAVKETVGERLLALEHLCPISDPARQSLDGTWEVLYMNTFTPGLIAAQVLENLPFPKGVACLDEILLRISGDEIKAVAKVKLMDSTYAEVDLVSTWTAESDIRVREVYQKGSVSIPELGSEEMMGAAMESAKNNTPMQIRNMVEQALSNAAPMLQNFGKGFDIPATGSYERVTLISYLDEDLMVARSLSGTPEVLRRVPDPPAGEQEMTLEMEDVSVMDGADFDFSDFSEMPPIPEAAIAEPASEGPVQ